MSNYTHLPNFFDKHLETVDPIIHSLIEKELKRLNNSIELIASENLVSGAVLQAQGSILTNKYAEGYPGKRYYGGCEYVDEIENIAITRAKDLFNAKFINVQPHSGSQANQAVFCALLKPHDKILGLSLDSGGHLTHGSHVNLSGKWFEAYTYDVDKHTGYINYEQMFALAKKYRPKLIITGGSAYPRFIDFKKFREAAEAVGAYLLVDMAHFAGQVAAQLHPNPLEFAHVVTTTTHKTLRGPRGGMILTNDENIAKVINSAIFPGIQGGPLMHVIAAKAVAFAEALTNNYKNYICDVLNNAKTLAQTLMDRGYSVLTEGTDTHLLLIDLRPHKITGKAAQISLEKAGLTCNKNSIPFDTQKPTITSGIRIGTPAATTRGFKQKEFTEVGNLIADVLDGLALGLENNNLAEEKALLKVLKLCQHYPIY